MGHTPAQILDYTNTIATVGASNDPEKSAYTIPAPEIARQLGITKG